MQMWRRCQRRTTDTQVKVDVIRRLESAGRCVSNLVALPHMLTMTQLDLRSYNSHDDACFMSAESVARLSHRASLPAHVQSSAQISRRQYRQSCRAIF